MSAKKKEMVKKQEPCAPLFSLPADRPHPHSHNLLACGEGQLSSLTGMKQEKPSIRVQCSGGSRMCGPSPGPAATFLKALSWCLSWPPHQLRADPTKEREHRTQTYGICSPHSPCCCLHAPGRRASSAVSLRRNPPGKSAQGATCAGGQRGY